MSIQSIAVVSAKSFGDFVIAHSVLHRIEPEAHDRVRLIAGSHVRDLTTILPEDVRVTFLALAEERVPAIFDVRKRGALSAVRSALWLRRELNELERLDQEVLAFEGLGMRERFIAGGWPVISPQRTRNIYETYARFLTDRGIPVASATMAVTGAPIRLVGIFPESRLAAKTLNEATVATIMQRVSLAGFEARLFIMEGDPTTAAEADCVVRIPRNFESLAAAIRSVDCVISADSLPAHLADYFARPVFVAAPVANEYWLPNGCYSAQSWGLFSNPAAFSLSLDRFLSEGRR
jgi:ADP-heptose:LPS heptosyltransferase